MGPHRRGARSHWSGSTVGRGLSHAWEGRGTWSPRRSSSWVLGEVRERGDWRERWLILSKVGAAVAQPSELACSGALAHLASGEGARRSSISPDKATGVRKRETRG